MLVIRVCQQQSISIIQNLQNEAIIKKLMQLANSLLFKNPSRPTLSVN